MKKYLITGGAGFIGRAIAKKLSKEGNYIRILDNESRGSASSIKKIKNIDFINTDIRDIKRVSDACKNIDIIIHLAFINGTHFFYEKPDLVLEVGVKGILNILEGAKNSNVKEFFLASSSEVYQTPTIIPTPENVPLAIPDPLNPRYSYAGGKIISELISLYMGKEFLNRTVIFRPHNVYGPNMGREHVIPELITKLLIAKMKDGKIDLNIQGDGSQSRSFIFINDFVDGVNLLLKKGKHNNIYNIGSDKEITIKEIIQKLELVMKCKINIISGDKPQGGTDRRCPDITKIKNLGFNPKINIEKGLLETYKWYKENYNA